MLGATGGRTHLPRPGSSGPATPGATQRPCRSPAAPKCGGCRDGGSPCQPCGPCGLPPRFGEPKLAWCAARYRRTLGGRLVGQLPQVSGSEEPPARTDRAEAGSTTEARVAGSRPRPIVRCGRRAPEGAGGPGLRWPVPPSRQSRRVQLRPKLLPGSRASRRQMPETVAAGLAGHRGDWLSPRRPCTARAMPDREV
jgi:hypothetical protein